MNMRRLGVKARYNALEMVASTRFAVGHVNREIFRWAAALPTTASR
jgi:hypothetical protein